MPTPLPNRGLLRVTGEDRVSFLQGLLTNDVTLATQGTGVYACLLTAQGRFLHDMFIVAHGDALLIDCEADRREDLLKRLRMFRLKAKVELEDVTSEWDVAAAYEPVADICITDPRTPQLGYRVYSPSRTAGGDAGAQATAGMDEYDRLRITLGVPDGSRDMPPGEALLLENNIDQLNGIAWTKGCYVGQELTARMKYKAQPKKRLMTVRIEGPVPEPGTVLYDGEREVGEMRSSCGDLGLALLRLDAGEVITSGETKLTKTCHTAT